MLLIIVLGILLPALPTLSSLRYVLIHPYSHCQTSTSLSKGAEPVPPLLAGKPKPPPPVAKGKPALAVRPGTDGQEEVCVCVCREREMEGGEREKESLQCRGKR